MKRIALLLTFGLLAMPIVSHAQTYDKAHQIKAAEFSNVIMPTFVRSKTERLSEADVMALQYLLRNRGFYQAKVDGKFGDVTEKAVKNFQRAKGLKVDGIVGPQTWAPLLLRLKRGDKGDAVRALQILLRDLLSEDGRNAFLDLPADGKYGAQTEKVVRIYQEEWGPYFKQSGLKVDGIVASQTWAGLLGAQFDG